MNIILFDGICNMCNYTVSFLIKHDTRHQLHFAAQQSQSGKNMINQHGIDNDKKSVILIKGVDVFYKSDAIIEIAKLITGWPSILQYCSILPRGFRNVAYDCIARNRYRIFGKKTNCPIPLESNKNRFI